MLLSSFFRWIVEQAHLQNEISAKARWGHEVLSFLTANNGEQTSNKKIAEGTNKLLRL